MKKFILLFAIMVNVIVYSQEDGKGVIDVQIPTLTESYSIIKTDMVQFENGLDYYGNSRTFGYGTFVIGSVSERVELRLFTDYKQFNSIGGKFIVMEPDKFGVGASFVAMYDLENNIPDARLSMTKGFGKVFTTYNLGFNGDIYNILLLGVPIGDDWGWFGEYYNDPTMNRYHSGITWIPQRYPT